MSRRLFFALLSVGFGLWEMEWLLIVCLRVCTCGHVCSCVLLCACLPLGWQPECVCELLLSTCLIDSMVLLSR